MEIDERKIAIEEGKKLSYVGWSFQLLLALQAVSPVKRFKVNENQTWEVEFSDIPAPVEISNRFLEQLKAQGIKV